MTRFTSFKRRHVTAIAAALILAACGQVPPPLPPPNANGSVGAGGLCGAVPAAAPVVPGNAPVNGNLTGASMVNDNSITFSLFYQTQANTLNPSQSVVGSGTVSLPAILPMTVMASSQSSTYCIASANPQGGGVVPGQYSSASQMSESGLQIVFSSLIPTSLQMTPYGGYPGAYFVPGSSAGMPGFGIGGNARMDIQVGFSCPAYLSNAYRLQGCVDISIQQLGIFANAFSQ